MDNMWHEDEEAEPAGMARKPHNRMVLVLAVLLELGLAVLLELALAVLLELALVVRLGLALVVRLELVLLELALLLAVLELEHTTARTTAH